MLCGLSGSERRIGHAALDEGSAHAFVRALDEVLGPEASGIKRGEHSLR